MANKNVVDHFQALNLKGFDEGELEEEFANDGLIFGLPNHLQVSWENPAFVMAERGTLKYPNKCPNHHLAMDNFRKWRRNHLKRRRHRFNQRFIKRWGKKPPIEQGISEDAPPNAFKLVSCYCDLVMTEIFPKLDNVSKQSAALLCKAWAKDIREISPTSDFRRFLCRKVIAFVGEYYKALVTRGPDRSIYTIQYKCACQRWYERIERNSKFNWTLVEPSDGEFEDYLSHEGLRDIVANLPSDDED